MKNIITCNILDSVPRNIKVAIFSTTEISIALKKFLQKNRPDIEIVCFIDSFKYEETLEELKIYHPNNIPQNIDFVIIASKRNKNVLVEILKKNNCEKYITIGDALWEIILQNKSQIKEINFVPSGHYYSPIPTPEEAQKAVENAKKEIDVDSDNAIDYNIEQQLENLHFLESIRDKFVFTKSKVPNNYFYYGDNNHMYREKCGFTLMGMVLKYHPRRIIEVGSGFSTALLHDTNRLYFENKIKISSIEPYPYRLKALFKEDYNKLDLKQTNLQEIPLDYFTSLEANDLLFIDSSHVSKANSDVNYVFFKILPILKKGVVIHFHDMFYPFEYPKAWHEEKRYWNELYFIRAFLAYNKAFSIEFFGDYMSKYIEQKNIPSLVKGRLGHSLYIKKLID